MKVVDEQVRNSLLFDFYGNLLTEKQQNVADLYFNCDLNFTEIAKKMKVTRQAVYFSIKNIEKDLEKYESSLKLYYNKYSKIKRNKNV